MGKIIKLTFPECKSAFFLLFAHLAYFEVRAYFGNAANRENNAKLDSIG